MNSPKQATESMADADAIDIAKAAGLPVITKSGDYPWAYKERVLAAISAAYSMGLKAYDPSGQAQHIERIDVNDLDAAEKAITERIGTAPFIPADSNHLANITLHMIREIRAARQQKAAWDTPLFIGACITEGRLHTTVNRYEANGHVTCVATAEMDVEALKGRDCIAEMKRLQADGEPPTDRQRHIIDCMDSWALAVGLPTYSNLSAPHQQAADHVPGAGEMVQQAGGEPCACWPGRMCNRQSECARDVKQQAGGEVPDGVWEALQRLIENGETMGPASREDAVVVASYRDKVRFMAAPATPAPEPLTRFCPCCGSIGPVPSEFKDCCPDGSHARDIPEQLAHRCHDLFQLAIEAARAQTKAEPVREPKADKPAGCIKPDTDAHVYFYEQDCYVLSNFSAFRVTFDGQTFDTSEAAYHYQRFTAADDRRGVQYANSAHEAFRYAQDNKAKQRPDWDAVKVDTMRDILRAKAQQHEYVRRKLLATGDRILVEDSWRDDFWGWGPDRNGQNMLGKLWMEVRSELREQGS